MSKHQFDCNVFVKGEAKSSISNLTDALAHYRSKAGGSVPASQALIEEMKCQPSFQNTFGPNGDVTRGIANKIHDALNQGRSHVQSEPGSRRGLSCHTLGSYSVNIEYNHPVCHGENRVNVHLWGYDSWDFEDNKGYNAFENFIKERIPGFIAGDGKAFNITYDFNHIITIHA